MVWVIARESIGFVSIRASDLYDFTKRMHKSLSILNCNLDQFQGIYKRLKNR
jgi:hypothetical protein